MAWAVRAKVQACFHRSLQHKRHPHSSEPNKWTDTVARPPVSARVAALKWRVFLCAPAVQVIEGIGQRRHYLKSQKHRATVDMHCAMQLLNVWD